jgi:CheY-like chemotaxis protein
MGGDIGVESKPGVGSTFWFVLSFARPAPRGGAGRPDSDERPASERLQTEFSGRRILLAEDEPSTQIVARELLEIVGLNVDLADNGQQALELACQNRYALILMDMQMPVLNGIDATLGIRADSLNSETPILALTANAYDEDRDRCLAAGMNDHIAKPVVPERFYDALLYWLSRPGD